MKDRIKLILISIIKLSKKTAVIFFAAALPVMSYFLTFGVWQLFTTNPPVKASMIIFIAGVISTIVTALVEIIESLFKLLGEKREERTLPEALLPFLFFLAAMIVNDYGL